MTAWVRLWHDMPTDPKFRTIARAAKQPLPVVVAVFTFMLTDASANENERGRTTATDEDIASAFDLDEDTVVAIRKAMQGRVLDGDKLSGWATRQPKKEDESAARAKAWREKKQAEAHDERSRTLPNDDERPDVDADTEPEKTVRPPKPPEGGARSRRREKNGAQKIIQMARSWKDGNEGSREGIGSDRHDAGRVPQLAISDH